MILVDANLLIYATISSCPPHVEAHAWLEKQLNSGNQVGLPWPSLLAFIRVVTNPRVSEHPLGVTTAWAQVEEWLALPTVWIPQPSKRHAEILGRLLYVTNAKGNLVSDAHLAALSIEHNLVLCSTDSDFAKFPGLNWYNPLPK